MTDKELRRLSRKELLEILIEQSKENDDLKQEIDSLKQEINSQKIKISKAGSIAEAALSINGVYEAAQAAADQYLLNVKNRADEVCNKMIKEAKKQAEKIINNSRR